jgi:hypothetical protein
MSNRKRIPPEIRFWKYVRKASPEECWIWTGAATPLKYGKFRLSCAKQVAAHRYSVELAGRSIPPGRVVMHSCDNPPCVNPAHLVIGTLRDNALDMVAKGRNFRAQGELHGNSKLTADIIKAIRLESGTMREIADRHGLWPSTVNNIRRRLTWRHVA